MSEERLDLVVILGSVRENRFGHKVANWFREQAEQHTAFDVDFIDTAAHSLPLAMDFGRDSATVDALAELSPRLARADAFVVVTPEYNHSFPAGLKNLIDWHSVEWRAKPVGFVSYGGMAGGLRAVEQLRLVFAETHSVTVRETVSLHNPWGSFDEPDESTQSRDIAAKTMLDQLTWWADALHRARERHPYGT